MNPKHTQSPKPQLNYLNPLWIIGSISLTLILTNPAQAQISPDGSTPTSAPCTGNCTITGGTTAGSNLFHSFTEFNVNSGQTVLFNAPGVNNVFSRVTGSNSSNILGTLGVTGSSANLFLMNPNGIIFGQNSSLNLTGSFVATTANSIKFGNQGEFSASRPPGENLAALTVNPTALLFNQIAAQPIINRSLAPDAFTPGVTSGLRTGDNKSLLLMGGNVIMDGGFLTAGNGLIDIGGLAGSGEIGLQFYGNVPFTNFDKADANNVPRSDISVANGAVLNATAVNGSTFEAGRIFLTGRSISISGKSQITTSVFGQQNAGLIVFLATNNVSIENSAILSIVKPGATGQGGGIGIWARSLSITNGGTLTTETRGRGNAGVILLQVDDDILIQGMNSPVTSTLEPLVAFDTGLYSTVYYTGTGRGGLIDITARSLSITNSAGISVSSGGTGNAGDTNINLRQNLTMDRGGIAAVSLNTGGGDIKIAATNVRLRNHSLVSTSVFSGNGGGGDITITGNDPQSSIFLALEDSDILAAAKFGRGGNINIDHFPGYIADIYAVPKDNVDARIFRGNLRVDISASSEFGLNGNVKVPDFSFLQNSISSLSGNFVSADQVVAGSCLARRNAEQGSFTVTGTGGLPSNPDDAIRGQYPITNVQPLSGEGRTRRRETTAPNPQKSQVQNWQLGNPVQEAQGITVTQGRIILSNHPQQVAMGKAEDLICHTNE